MRLEASVLAGFVALGAVACTQLIGVDDPRRVDPPENLGSGPFVLAHAGLFIETATLDSVSATVAPTGELTDWSAPGQSPGIGTNNVLDLGGVMEGPVVWGRWAGGVTTGQYTEAEPLTRSFGPNSGLHYALGRAPRALAPSSGTVQYSLVGSTHPTQGDGSSVPGSLTGTAVVEFAGASTKIGIALTIEMPGDATYLVVSPGGPDNPSVSNLGLLGSYVVGTGSANRIKLTSAGRACTPPTCVGDVTGFFAGDRFERLALVVQVFSGGASGGKTSVSAAAVFRP